MIKSGIQVVSSLEEASSLGSYDILYCNQVLEHINNPRDVLGKLNTMMKPNGVTYFSVPNYCLKNLNEQIQLVHSAKPIPKELNPWEHLNYFTPKSFYSLIIKAGFKPITFLPIEPSLWFNEGSNIRFLKDTVRIEWKLLKSALAGCVKKKKRLRETEVYARA
jgi:2-polyprenyl-3-methyl-5-hydroxy-6-metoxy-1,4-benzoquinol methylase